MRTTTKRRIVMKMMTLQPIKAPKVDKNNLIQLLKRYELDKKYGEIAYHLDYIFIRQICPIHNKREIWLSSAMRGALNRWLALSEKPYKIITACTSEENVILYQRKMHTKKNSTLVNMEVILPESYIYVLLETDSKEVIEILNRSKMHEIILGGMSREGFGRCRIVEVSIL